MSETGHDTGRIDVSVVLCTHNRAESLRRTLLSCCDLSIPGDVSWELLVVDNNSTDHTRSVCEELTARLPLRYAFEPIQGRSNALNRAVEITTGDLVVFTDDDVTMSPGWLAEMHESAVRHPDAAYFAGRIVPTWDGDPPMWLAENLDSLLGMPFVLFDLGDAELETPYAVGANMAVRAEAFDGGARFRSDIGVNPARKRTNGEEAHLVESLRLQDRSGWFVPKAIVYHHTTKERMTERYIRDWFVADGRTDARLGHIVPHNLWFGAPRGQWKKVVLSALRYGVARPLAASETWLRAEIEMAHGIGVIDEMRTQARDQKVPGRDD